MLKLWMLRLLASPLHLLPDVAALVERCGPDVLDLSEGAPRFDVLPSGSTVLLYTDGVTDVLDSQDNPFGLERLHQALLTQRSAPAQVLCETLLEMISAHRAATPQYDDITLVAVQAKS